MLLDIIEVRVVKDYTLYLRFENDVSGEIDISKIISFKGVFAKLKDPHYFKTVILNKELGTIVWDNGADISSSFLYSIISQVA